MSAKHLRTAMIEHGYQPPSVIVLGCFHRLGKKTDQYCKLFADAMAGFLGDNDRQTDGNPGRVKIANEDFPPLQYLTGCTKKLWQESVGDERILANLHDTNNDSEDAA